MSTQELLVLDAKILTPFITLIGDSSARKLITALPGN
jgi:hypothetical protein